MKPFEIHAPHEIAEASRLLQNLEDAAVYAGGTELLLAMKAGFLHAKHLVDIKHVAELEGLSVEHELNEIVIGATVTHRQIERSTEVRRAFPLLCDIEATVGNVRVRNCGTIGGNLSFAEPHSDIASLAVLLGATITLVRESDTRSLDAGEFLLGAFETELQPGELLKNISIPVPSSRAGIGYKRFTTKERPLVIVGACIIVDEEGIVRDPRVVVGGATPVPHRFDVSDILAGEHLDRVPDLLENVGNHVSKGADVITDLEGSGDYKRHLIGVFAKRAFLGALADLGGGAR